MLQNARVTAFTVFELLKESNRVGKIRKSWVGDVFILKPATASCLSYSSSNFIFLGCLDYLYRFASALHSCAVVETKSQIERSTYCHQALEKLLLSFSLILLTLLNGCWIPKRFSSFVCSNSTLFFFASWGEYMLGRMFYLRWHAIE